MNLDSIMEMCVCTLYLWALRTIVRFLAYKSDEIGKRIVSIHIIRIFCINMSWLRTWTMMARCWCMTRMLMMRLSINTMRFRLVEELFQDIYITILRPYLKNILVLSYEPLQLYWVRCNLWSLLLHLCFIIILWCMIFRCLWRTMLIQNTSIRTQILSASL